MWEWELECNSFDVATGSTQISPSRHALNFVWGEHWWKPSEEGGMSPDTLGMLTYYYHSTYTSHCSSPPSPPPHTQEQNELDPKECLLNLYIALRSQAKRKVSFYSLFIVSGYIVWARACMYKYYSRYFFRVCNFHGFIFYDSNRYSLQGHSAIYANDDDACSWSDTYSFLVSLSRCLVNNLGQI